MTPARCLHEHGGRQGTGCAWLMYRAKRERAERACDGAWDADDCSIAELLEHMAAIKAQAG